MEKKSCSSQIAETWYNCQNETMRHFLVFLKNTVTNLPPDAFADQNVPETENLKLLKEEYNGLRDILDSMCDIVDLVTFQQPRTPTNI